MAQKHPPTLNLLQITTKTSQISSLLFTSLIIYLGLSGEFVFINWHPLLLCTAWVFLMGSAMSVMSNNSTLTASLSRDWKINLHAILHQIGLIATFAGMFVIYNVKETHNYPHYTTLHGICGLISIIGGILSGLGGAVIQYSTQITKYIKLKYLKLLHVIGGSVSYFFGGITLIFSLYTQWFSTASNESKLLLVVAFLLLNVTFWGTLANPVTGLVGKFANFDSKSKKAKK